MNKQAGLTLVEIMIVLIILSIVMAFVGGKIFGKGDQAKADLTSLKMQQLKADIEQFQLRYNTLPGSLDDLVKCGEKTGPGCLPISNEDSLADAWGNQFLYQSSGRTYKIKSLGSDAKDGGEGAAYDIALEGP